MLGAIARGQVDNLLGPLKPTLGWVPSHARDVSLDALVPPDSRFAREAEDACAAQPATLATHGHRTWAFGSALLTIDGVRADPELFYAACLLHDAGLVAAVPEEDFTLRSSARALDCAQRAGLSAGAAAAVADAITAHTTPGIDPGRDGALGAYVQAGAMVDLAFSTRRRRWSTSAGSMGSR